MANPKHKLFVLIDEQDIDDQHDQEAADNADEEAEAWYFDGGICG